MKFHYVYLLVSLSHPGRRYVGLTEDLKARLAKHNRGEVPHTSKYTPWAIDSAHAFKDREKERERFGRRSAIGPVIGHLKNLSSWPEPYLRKSKMKI